MAVISVERDWKIFLTPVGSPNSQGGSKLDYAPFSRGRREGALARPPKRSRGPQVFISITRQLFAQLLDWR
jgi:hypothetical protein